MSTMDQDTFNFEPIVWITTGEVVGNQIVASVRCFRGVYQWFVSINTAMGDTAAQSGVEGSLESARKQCMLFIYAELECEAME